MPEVDRIFGIGSLLSTEPTTQTIMKSLPKIARIIKIEPFKITMLWNTAEIRVLDFAPFFEVWEEEGDAKMAALRD